MSHLNENDRKTISNMLSHKATCKEIASIIGCDPTTIAKEIKRNRVISKEALTDRKFICKKLERYPYVCLDCRHKYKDCTFTQLRYDSGYAQRKYEAKLHNSRKGINLTLEEHVLLNKVLHEGLLAKKSIYTIAHSNKVPVSVPTIYRYIKERKVSVSKMDLPYAVTYKKRKKAIKKYEYPENNKVDRMNRTFLDYLAYKKTHINELGSQMDFLGSIKSDNKSILVIIIPEIHFPFLFIVENKNSKKVVEIFNELESSFGYDKFTEIFPSILTDRDPSFSDIYGIEYSPENGSQRTHLFFCDAFKSNQKASVENMNKQIRKFFPKGASVDGYTKWQIKEINRTLVESQILSLDGYSPKQAFITLFGLETYEKYFGK
jgi:IS30 family transposase